MYLSALQAREVRNGMTPTQDYMKAPPFTESRLPATSQHEDEATRVLYNVLATFAKETIPEEDAEYWDANDNLYIAMVAWMLDQGTMQISDVTWTSATGWSRDAAFVATAVHMYFADREEKAAGNPDMQADLEKKRAYIYALLNLEDSDNPFRLEQHLRDYPV